jgi:hypothetical protein
MPLYGQSFSLADSGDRGLNAKSYGPGEAGEFTRAGGFLAFYEVPLLHSLLPDTKPLVADLRARQEAGLDRDPRPPRPYRPLRLHVQPVGLVRRRGRNPAQIAPDQGPPPRGRHDLGAGSRRLPQPVRLRQASALEDHEQRAAGHAL